MISVLRICFLFILLLVSLSSQAEAPKFKKGNCNYLLTSVEKIKKNPFAMAWYNTRLGIDHVWELKGTKWTVTFLEKSFKGALFPFTWTSKTARAGVKLLSRGVGNLGKAVQRTKAAKAVGDVLNPLWKSTSRLPSNMKIGMFLKAHAKNKGNTDKFARHLIKMREKEIWSAGELRTIVERVNDPKLTEYFRVNKGRLDFNNPHIYYKRQVELPTKKFEALLAKNISKDSLEYAFYMKNSKAYFLNSHEVQMLEGIFPNGLPTNPEKMDRLSDYFKFIDRFRTEKKRMEMLSSKLVRAVVEGDLPLPTRGKFAEVRDGFRATLMELMGVEAAPMPSRISYKTILADRGLSELEGFGYYSAKVDKNWSKNLEYEFFKKVKLEHGGVLPADPALQAKILKNASARATDRTNLWKKLKLQCKQRGPTAERLGAGSAFKDTLIYLATTMAVTSYLSAHKSEIASGEESAGYTAKNLGFDTGYSIYVATVEGLLLTNPRTSPLIKTVSLYTAGRANNFLIARPAYDAMFEKDAQLSAEELFKKLDDYIESTELGENFETDENTARQLKEIVSKLEPLFFVNGRLSVEDLESEELEDFVTEWAVEDYYSSRDGSLPGKTPGMRRFNMDVLWSFYGAPRYMAVGSLLYTILCRVPDKRIATALAYLILIADQYAHNKIYYKLRRDGTGT